MVAKSLLTTPCEHRDGTGKAVPDCEECQGNGWVEDPSDGGTMTCPYCNDDPCEECEGTGLTPLKGRPKFKLLGAGNTTGIAKSTTNAKPNRSYHMRPNYTQIVKTAMPDFIKATPRGTFLFKLDGQDEVFPTFTSAARHLGKELHLNTPNWDEVAKRTGIVVKQSEDRKITTIKGPEESRKRQRRSIGISLPPNVVAELAKNGRVKVLLKVS